jgi:alpha-beta hydrolase superfamily lysophospholipase
MRPPGILPALCSWRLSDAYELRGRVWRPESGRADAVLYLHGIQSHGGWFEWSAALIAEAMKCAVILPDRRGSGLNQAARGDTPSAQRWLDDLDELANWAESEWRIKRLDVVAVSWGGKLAVAWAVRRRARVRRLLLVAPGFFPAVDVGLAGRLRIMWALLSDPRRRLPVPLDDPALFTDNPAGREFIRNDPLKLTQATARFLYASNWLDRHLRRIKPGNLQAHATLLLAGRDRIIRNRPTSAWLQRIASRPPAIQMLPEAAHTLELEPDPAALRRLVIEWAGGGVR